MGALHDVDGQTADCPDELLEAMQVDEDRILDVDAGERLHSLPDRLDARVLDAGGERRPVLVSPLVEAVERALVPTVPADRHQPLHQGSRAEVDVLGVAGKPEHP